MPDLQIVNLNPSKRAEETPLEITLGGFAKRLAENREADVLKDIYDQFKKEGSTIEDRIAMIRSKPGLTPSTRVSAIKEQIDVHAKNKSIQKDIEKELKEQEYDKIEVQFLEDIKDKKLTPLELYKEALARKLPRERAKTLASTSRMQERENRLSIKGINDEYNSELKILDRKIKETLSRKQKELLIEERDEIEKKRKHDLNRFKKGETNFQLSLYEDEDEPNQAAEDMEVFETPIPTKEETAELRQQAEDQLDEVVKYIIYRNPQEEIPQDFAELINELSTEEIESSISRILKKNDPVEKADIGAIRYLPAQVSPDGKPRKYKSDGKQWVLVK